MSLFLYYSIIFECVILRILNTLQQGLRSFKIHFYCIYKQFPVLFCLTFR